ncbi:MAG: transketolase C-terminal domain-containing protein, partial [Acidimicrobiia bacterium]
EPIRLYRAFREEVPAEKYTVPIGEAARVREGHDVTVIAYGAMLRQVLQAADRLEEEGVMAEVVDLRSLVPLDAEAVSQSVQKTGRAVVVAEGHRTGGFAAELVALIQERALYSLLAPVERVTGWDTVVPLRRSESYYIPNAERVVAAARRTLEG